VIYRFPYKGEWQEYDSNTLAGTKESSRKWIAATYADYCNNRMSFFLPHGVPHHSKNKLYANGQVKLPPSQYPARYKNDGVAFINDRKNQYVLLLSGRKFGKTTAGAAKIGFELCPCDPAWHCFVEHGIEWHEWGGPTVACVSSFGMQNLADVWKVYQEILPRHELMEYAPQWGRFDGETGRPKTLSFGSGRPQTVHLKCGSQIIFLAYTQQQHVWESFKSKYLHADEQIPTNLLRAWEDGSSTFGDYTPAIFTLSGFVLDERPEDTGASGPIKKIWDGRHKSPKTVGRYNLDLESTPDAILSKAKKKERWDRYCNPTIKRTAKDARRGLAACLPGWEPQAGLLFGPDCWSRDHHLIEPLWLDDKVPRDFTKWRVIDYADKKVTCCSWWAVSAQHVFLYRLLYEEDMLIFDTVRKIIRMSHNEMVEIGQEENSRTGTIYKVFREEQTKEQYYSDLLDPRAAEWIKEGGANLIDTMRRYGLQNLNKASGAHNESQIPVLKEMFRIDWSKPHPFNKGDDGKALMGCPRVFIFNGRCNEAVEELETVPASEDARLVMDRKSTHDFIDTAKYFASDDPQYYGDIGRRTEREAERQEERRIATPYTGW